VGVEVPGELSVWLALVANVMAGVAFLLAATWKRSLDSLAVRSYHLFTFFTTLAVIYLFYLFFSHNYAFKYVYDYNELSQPFFYILSGFWGGQEGTYLLWVFFNALFGYALMRHGGRYKLHAMTVFSLVNLFLLVILVKLSPFALLPTPAADGLGLNPLLRDPWMVIHPPVMFLGYAIASIPFSISMAALLTNDYSDWIKRAFPWVASCALMLGAGNILGGYWAYKTLGWGGYWGWDPVENASLVPWVVSLALIHGLVIERQSGALRKTNLLLTALVFLLVVYGTFLTRSGVLADFSVHSFVDLGINIYLVGFMILFAVMTLVIFAVRAGQIKSSPLDYGFFGLEFSRYAGLLVLLIFGLVVLFWSSLPILSSAFLSEPRAADIATYNSFALPLAALMAFLLTISPHLRHTQQTLSNARKKILTVLIVATVVGFGLFYFALSAGLTFSILFSLIVGGMLVYALKPDLRKGLIPALTTFLVTIGIAVALGVSSYRYLLFFATAAMAAVSNGIAIGRFLPGRWKFVGGRLTHFGFGLMLLGIMASSAFDTTERLVIAKGQSAMAGSFGLAVQYQGMENDIEYANNELILELDDGSGAVEIRPQLYYSERMGGIMRKPSIERSLLHDMYLAPEQVQPTDDSHDLVLRKGEARQFGDIEVTFVGFEMGNHEQTADGDLRVTAALSFRHGEEEVEAKPALLYGQDDLGQPVLENLPATVTIGDRSFDAMIEQNLADQGMVALSIPTLMPQGQLEKLIISISKKPMINLVWAGTTLILLGTLLVFMRRREERGRTDIR